ncbi:MAG TPA: asparagine synthase (glutamine-hydrolyzing) [Burkholderiaceae bacterium]|nr:asparagine synthase (glutamine-hydrolyzing) [Burkholderiaceae bacterium]
MCGIAGIVSANTGTCVRDVALAMARAVAHRGPDDEGVMDAVCGDGRYRVALAHRRLSIIDLTSGHQPLGNEDGSVQIVFNGEIYNFEALREQLLALGHRMCTRSDTEVIVHAYEQWGLDCVARLRGMFAFAIWDTQLQRLFLARDRFGKKPLFIASPGAGELLFASEIKAILAHGRVSPEVEPSAIRDYFFYRYVPAPATMFRGIRKLMPGSAAVWQRGELREWRYYSPPDGRPPLAAAPADDIVQDFLSKLDEAVAIRMISDVPFGAFLSGGIDSSAVVALMTRHSSQPVRTFSVGFSDARYSELDYARTIATHFGTDHHELVVSQNDLIEHLPALVRFRDAPVAEPSDIPVYLLSREARRTVKMVLTGEGADEFLGGYPKHAAERFAAWYQMLPRALRRDVLESMANALPFKYRRIKTAMATLGVEDRQWRMARWFGALTREESDGLLVPELASMPAAHSGRAAEAGSGSALRGILYFDQTSWLPDNLLERGDRMTMAASLEARMPFMDHELAAFVSGLPDRWRVHGMQRKYILRQAMRRLIPRAILERPKVGFRVPVSDWFRGPMSEYLRDHLCAGDTRIRDFVRPQALQRVVAEHVDGRQNHEKLLWSMLTLEIWHRQYL